MTAKAVTKDEPEQKSGGRGTFLLSEVAQVRMRGGDIPAPGSEAEEVVLAAWAAYRYIRALAQRTGKPAIRHGREGWELEMQIQDVFHSVWRAGASPLPMAGASHDDARRQLTAWLGVHKNLTIVSRGNPDIHGKRASVASKPSRWWVAEEFSGVPEGMRLPEVSALTGEVLKKPEAAPEQPAKQGGVVRDWWCPYENQCKFGAPLTEAELGRHFVDIHSARPGSTLYQIFMEDARKLHGTPEPEPEPEPETPGVLETLRVSQAPVQPPAPAPVPASASAPVPVVSPTVRTRVRTVTPSVPQGGGQVSAQARVFFGEVTALEDEVIRLRQRVRDLTEENVRLRKDLANRDDSTKRITLSAATLDELARRTANLVKSEHELS